MLCRLFLFLTAYYSLILPAHSSSLLPDNEAWFFDPFFADPIREDDLDGSMIVYLRSVHSPVPLLYPKHLNFFELLDFSVLNSSRREAELLKKSQQAVALSKKNKSDPRMSGSSHLLDFDISTREDQLFDSVHLLKREKNVPLPSDEELQAFLLQSRSSDEEFSQENLLRSLLKDEYADNPVSSLLSQSPIVKKVLSSEKYRLDKPGLFRSAEQRVENSSVVSSKTGIDSQVSPNAQPLPQETVLRLKASKPSNDGSIQPAQASEIYLTTRDLKELLKDLDAGSAIAGEVQSVAELWAKAEKNDSQNPEIALGVKSILLQAKVGRARTDPYGQASLENLPPDDQYFLIGIDKDILTNVVTIWSKQVEVAPGENLVELTSTDVIYQE